MSVPYIIGIKNDFLRDVNIDVLGDLVIVDIDSGECQVFGYTENVCILEESTSVTKHASEQLEKVAGKVWNWGSKASSIDMGLHKKQKLGVASVIVFVSFVFQAYYSIC